MRKKILAMMSAFILTITCIAPLNIKAEWVEPTQITVYIYDMDGNVVTTCDFSPGTNTSACGTDWRNNNTSGFSKFVILANVPLQPNQTMDFHIETSITGINYSDGVSEMGYYYYGSKFHVLDATTYEVEIHHNDSISLDMHGTFTNNTGHTSTMLEYSFTNYSGSLIDFTTFKLNHYTFNVYDEYGRLIQTIENSSNHIYNGLTGIHNMLVNLDNTIKDKLLSLSTNIDYWIRTQTTAITTKLDDLMNAIRGDNKDVSSKVDLDNTTNDLDNVVNDYDDIESSIVDDFNNNFGSIKPNNDLVTNNDFINTSTFVAAQMTRIYESNDIIRMTITFGLIIGLAFTVIGISVRR